MRRAWVCSFALLLLVVACSGGPPRLVIAAGTTLVDAGFIDEIAAEYEASHPDVEVSVVAEPTRLALELGREGAADVTITHAPLQEQAFVEDGHADESVTIFSSVFILVGPPELAASFIDFELPEVLREVAASEIPFVSRGDGSGTHDKEMENWLESGLNPVDQDWYAVTGQGMGPTLLIADQRGAVTLAEYGAFLEAAPSIGLVDLSLDPGALDNPYSAMVMSSSRNIEIAQDFVRWLQSVDGLAAIESANRELFGTIVYRPASQS